MDHTHCLSPARARAPDAAVTSSSYARLFPDLPAFTADEAFLYALGRAGGLCDCGDEDDGEASLGTEAAGWPFFGQFVAHDITADRSALQSHVDPARLRNARSPQLNLECLYGDGPVGHPYLFQRDDPASFWERTGRTCYATAKAPRSSAIRGTIRTCSCRRCTSRSSAPTTNSLIVSDREAHRSPTSLKGRPESCGGTIKRWSYGSFSPRSWART